MRKKYKELKRIINRNLIYLINNLFIAADLRENPGLVFRFNKYSQQIN